MIDDRQQHLSIRRIDHYRQHLLYSKRVAGMTIGSNIYDWLLDIGPKIKLKKRCCIGMQSLSKNRKCRPTKSCAGYSTVHMMRLCKQPPWPLPALHIRIYPLQISSLPWSTQEIEIPANSTLSSLSTILNFHYHQKCWLYSLETCHLSSWLPSDNEPATINNLGVPKS